MEILEENSYLLRQGRISVRQMEVFRCSFAFIEKYCHNCRSNIEEFTKKHAQTVYSYRNLPEVGQRALEETLDNSTIQTDIGMDHVRLKWLNFTDADEDNSIEERATKAILVQLLRH